MILMNDFKAEPQALRDDMLSQFPEYLSQVGMF